MDSGFDGIVIPHRLYKGDITSNPGRGLTELYRVMANIKINGVSRYMSVYVAVNNFTILPTVGRRQLNLFGLDPLHVNLSQKGARKLRFPTMSTKISQREVFVEKYIEDIINSAFCYLNFL